MPNGLQGKVAVIAGSSRDIGWAIARVRLQRLSRGHKCARWESIG